MGELRQETNKMEWAFMQTAPEQARFMSWLVETMQAKKAAEVGVFTGYSSLALATVRYSEGIQCEIYVICFVHAVFYP